MINPASFSTLTLSHHQNGDAVTRILAAAIQAVDPGTAVKRYFHRQENLLICNGIEYPLDEIKDIYVLGLGKAALAMSRPVEDILKDRISSGLLITKHIPVQHQSEFDLVCGGHPVPDLNSLLAGQKALEIIENLTESDLLVCLISGGGSALMTLPHLGISMEDQKILTSALLACGARVDEINILRRHIDRLKGVGLAQLAAPCKVVSLILSDVVGSPLEAIASGPTAPDPSTRADAFAILEKYSLLEKVPKSILETLQTAPETPKPGDDYSKECKM